MSRKQFEEFLSEKEEKQKKIADIDWDKNKNEWLQYLDKLYKLFQDSLRDYEQKGSVHIKVDRVSTSEEYIGTYTVPVMEIRIAGETIKLKPFGTNVLGAKGRVDMSGRKGSATLLLVDSRLKSMLDNIPETGHRNTRLKFDRSFPRQSEITWEWRFVFPPPTRQYMPVNEDTIYSTIMDLVLWVRVGFPSQVKNCQ